MDTVCIEPEFSDGTKIVMDTIAVENEWVLFLNMMICLRIISKKVTFN
ncbi:MAG: DUF6061 family protein [Clostridia bacterium]|nr:DUF6061 family protein [Clostridia bacterium]